MEQGLPASAPAVWRLTLPRRLAGSLGANVQPASSSATSASRSEARLGVGAEGVGENGSVSRGNRSRGVQDVKLSKRMDIYIEVGIPCFAVMKMHHVISLLTFSRFAGHGASTLSKIASSIDKKGPVDVRRGWFRVSVESHEASSSSKAKLDQRPPLNTLLCMGQWGMICSIEMSPTSARFAATKATTTVRLCHTRHAARAAWSSTRNEEQLGVSPAFPPANVLGCPLVDVLAAAAAAVRGCRLRAVTASRTRSNDASGDKDSVFLVSFSRLLCLSFKAL